jgi:hypothetical protein
MVDLAAAAKGYAKEAMRMIKGLEGMAGGSTKTRAAASDHTIRSRAKTTGGSSMGVVSQEVWAGWV